MARKNIYICILSVVLVVGTVGLWSWGDSCKAATADQYQSTPPFLTAGVPPLVMLVMGRNHKLYYEAYNDASDLNEDGDLDIRYNPDIDYYGYFDCYKCYKYQNNRFEPVRVTQDKTCNNSSGTLDYTDGEWSGNFLNYLTMSRMDTVRKVLYGGKRYEDTNAVGTSSVTLERAFIPQDAHSWGKEYDPSVWTIPIAKVAPLPEPSAGKRHLFACTTLSNPDSNGNYDPLLRVLTNTDHRIWEWVAKERPVADDSLSSGGTGGYWDSPDDHDEFEDMVLTYAVEGNRYGSNAPPNGRIDGNGNPWGPNYSPYDQTADDQQNYLTIFTGYIRVATSGDYWFAVDGDDAVEFIMTGVTSVNTGPTYNGHTIVSAWYGPHCDCVCNSSENHGNTSCNESLSTYSGNHSRFKGLVHLEAGVDYEIEFRHQEWGGGDNYWLYWKGPDSGNNWEIVPSNKFVNLIQSTYDCVEPGAGVLTDYKVRVVVCDPRTDSDGNSLLESNCKAYPSGTFKPVGLLQTHGESERMYFGLMTGSYTNNTSGGVLRKNISSFRDEVDSQTGQFTSVKGIVHTINNLRIIGYTYSGYYYNDNCGWITTHPIQEGECRMWGNPIAEMMYETLRYFSGQSHTNEFVDGITNGNDHGLDLPLPAWTDPYDLSNGGFDHCAQPFMLVISDVFPTYDSDQLPGVDSNFDVGFAGTLSSASGEALNVSSLADTIFTLEGESHTIPHYIGQVGTLYDGSCAPKTMTGFGDVRGLCPEEPTKRGSYYAASVAYFGRKEDISSAEGTQNVNTFSVGLASPLPRIEIPVGDNTITLVPFAKSVGGCLGVTGTEGAFQPTDTIVDFFVESLTPTSGVFRINYEDVEQGADHDMDAIVIYRYQVVDDALNPVADPDDGTGVQITLESIYASGCIIQHMGYTISGTTADGTYLEVRDIDTTEANDPDYFLDTPPGVAPHVPGNTDWDDDQPLPLVTTRVFRPGDTTAATILENPLWYAAKYGGFEENDLVYGTKNVPDLQSEWDEDADGVPDTYFYVVNPLKLEQQLNRSFAEILRRTSSGTAASVISNSRSGEGAIYQSIFYPEFKGPLGNAVSWAGEVHSLLVDAYGNMREDTNGNQKLDLTEDRIIVFDEGNVEKYADSNGNGQLDETESSTPVEVTTLLGINYLWSSTDWLNEISSEDNIISQRDYNSTEKKRYIFTFIDEDQDMLCDPGETMPFVCTSLPDSDDLVDDSKIYPYIQPFPPFNRPAYVDAISANSDVYEDFLKRQTQRIINFIRGWDQGNYVSTTSPTYTIPAFRNRKVDYDEDGFAETWRLGDVVHSTPTVVGRPSENYDLLYHDLTYSEFFRTYRKRRTVVYVGGNDGMLHAFNGGFYDPENKAFLTQPLNSDGTTDTSYTAYDLGAELWAYIPYNLLPHLYWLTESSYPHIYYCDLKVKVFDAKVFEEGVDSVTGINHPQGWGTILVGGMRFGGGKIEVDMDKTDGDVFDSNKDRIARSAFFVLDITDPESPPAVLAELSFEHLGFTSSYPTVIAMRNKQVSIDENGQTVISFRNPGLWYLVLGSGPANVNGEPDSTALSQATSSQTAKLYLIDLVKLCSEHELWSIDGSDSNTNKEGVFVFEELDANGFISPPVAVDYDLDFNTDAVYFGMVTGSEGSWGGKLRRIVINDELNPSDWDGDSVLLDLTPNPPGLSNGQPITAPPSVAIDADENRWIFFGTGRFFVRADADNSDQQSYYGLKEPSGTGGWTWSAIMRDDLLNVSNAEVYEDGTTVRNVLHVSNWNDLSSELEDQSGWYMDFAESKERNLGQATLLGDILTFTTYIPSLDPCEFEGQTNLYASYYKTGTAYFEAIIGLGTIEYNGQKEVLRKTSLGKGLSITPNIHTGREEGSKAYVQTSTGAIEVTEQANPGMTKSGRLSWQQE